MRKAQLRGKRIGRQGHHCSSASSAACSSARASARASAGDKTRAELTATAGRQRPDHQAGKEIAQHLRAAFGIAVAFDQGAVAIGDPVREREHGFGGKREQMWYRPSAQHTVPAGV